MNCQDCGVLITLLTSSRQYTATGEVVPQCLSCAIKAAPFVHFVERRRDHVIDDEIVCQKHWQQHSAPGYSMAPLSEGEKKAGMTQTITPLSKTDCVCVQCEDEAMQRSERKGAA